MLSVQNLSCRRSGRIVFRDLGFDLGAGGFLLVTGANGSGKSSFLRLLAGLLEPETGQVLWQKLPIADDPATYRAQLHYIGHLDAVKPSLTVREMLAYWCALRGTAQRGGEETLEVFGLSSLADSQARFLSAGQKRRLSLTRLVLNQAPLWLLDEPSSALDAAGQKLLMAQIAKHRATGGIVIAASHDALDIDDAQRLDMKIYVKARV